MQYCAKNSSKVSQASEDTEQNSTDSTLRCEMEEMQKDWFSRNRCTNHDFQLLAPLCLKFSTDESNLKIGDDDEENRDLRPTRVSQANISRLVYICCSVEHQTGVAATARPCVYSASLNSLQECGLFGLPVTLGWHKNTTSRVARNAANIYSMISRSMTMKASGTRYTRGE